MKTLFVTLPYKLLPKKPFLVIILWVVWVSLLWYLSSRSPAENKPPGIPHLDKVLHFAYFGCGAILVAQFLYLSKQQWITVSSTLLICLLVGATVGALDEYHQSHTPGRFGNDIFDWIADCLGSLAGALYMLWLRRKIDHATG